MGLLITSFEHFQGRLLFAENVRSFRKIILLASTPGGIHQVLVLGESLAVLESVFEGDGAFSRETSLIYFLLKIG